MQGSVKRRVGRIVCCSNESLRYEIAHGVLSSFRREEVEDLKANLDSIIREQNYTVQKLAKYTMDLRRISPKRYRVLLKDARHTVTSSSSALLAETEKVSSGSKSALESASDFSRFVQCENLDFD